MADVELIQDLDNHLVVINLERDMTSTCKWLYARGVGMRTTVLCTINKIIAQYSTRY